MVKVGDTIKVVNAKLAEGRYKNGDILTVEQIMLNNGVYVKEHNRCLWESEYEVVPNIRKGDTVRLIDKFYEHKVFKKQLRSVRKSIASLGGKVEKVNYIFKDRASVGFINCTTPLELLERVESTKHRYTDEQIAEAERIIGEIVAGFREGECFYVLVVTAHGIAIRYRTGMNDCYGRFDSRCSPNDEFNRTIGVMVALCKAVGRKLPEWV